MKPITIKLGDDLIQTLEKKAEEINVSTSHCIRSLIYKGLTLEQAIDHNPLMRRLGEMITENLILMRELIELNVKDKEASLKILVNAENRGRNYIKGKEYMTAGEKR